MRKINKIALLTSGGDAPGMNACIRAIVRTALFKKKHIYGFKRGFDGLIDNDILPLNSFSVSNIIQQGGTILKTARSKAFLTKEGRNKAIYNLKTNSIDALIVIGGNGSLKGSVQLAKECSDIAIVGVPGTIDNNLAGTDFTIGFDTAVNTVVEAVDKIRDTADSHNRIFFIEVMGGDSGMIALNSGIAVGAESILVPETPTYIQKLIDNLEKGWQRQKTSCIVIVAEGDSAGGAYAVAKQVEEKFSHYEAKVTVLGHVQRGGRPTFRDRVLAARLGNAAVENLCNGNHGIMIGEVNGKITQTVLNVAINKKRELNTDLMGLVDTLSI